MNTNEVKQLKNMLPDDLEKIKKEIEILLDLIISKRITNINYQIENKEILCPKCKSKNVVKNGFKNKIQRYKCRDCIKYFSINTNTITSHLKLSYKQLIDYFQCLISFNTIKETAQIVGISNTEAYYLRIKILYGLNNYKCNILHGEIECDEKYLRINLKGTKSKNMPRESHKNGFDNKFAGISNDQVCILMAIDSYDNIFAKVVGHGQITHKNLEEHFLSSIEEGSTLITDSKNTYKKFAKEHSLKLIQIPSKKYVTKDGKNLGELNQLMSDLEILILKCKGISTRHLQEYLDLFKAKKILNYTIEYLKQNKELYKFVIIQSTNLTARKVCKKEMPFDISKHYGCDFK